LEAKQLNERIEEQNLKLKLRNEEQNLIKLQSEAENLKMQEQSLQAQIRRRKVQRKIELAKIKREILNEFKLSSRRSTTKSNRSRSNSVHSVTTPFTQLSCSKQVTQVSIGRSNPGSLFERVSFATSQKLTTVIYQPTTVSIGRSVRP